MTEKHEKYFRVALEKLLPDGYYSIGDDTPDETGKIFILGTGKLGKINWEVDRRKAFGSLWAYHSGYRGLGIIRNDKIDKIRNKKFNEFTMDDIYDLLNELRQKQ